MRVRCASVLLPAPIGLYAQTIEVNPARVLVDQPAVIRVSGLQPNERAVIHAELADGSDARWSSQADFPADAQGKIEAPATGLIWSMMPASKKEARYQPPRDFGAQTIEFQLMRGGARAGAARLEQAPVAEGVGRVTLHDGSLRGVLFVPPGQGRHPGILVLGGSEGGMPSRRAGWLASHGYAALALAYFRFDDLPKELAGIPLEYFGQALNWMMHRPEIAPDSIGVAGVSRGAELALQLGAMYTPIKAVVAWAPSNVRNPACCGFTSVPYAWTWKGSGLAFRPLRSPAAMAGRAVIEVEHTQGPILLISGDADRVWESSSMADSVVRRLNQFHFAYGVEHLKYPHAGHTAGRPEIVPAWQGLVKNPTSGREMDMGGTPRGNAESSIDAIPKILDFLERSLAVH